MKDVKKFDVEIDERYLCDCGNGSRIIEVVSETGDYVLAADYDALLARTELAVLKAGQGDVVAWECTAVRGGVSMQRSTWKSEEDADGWIEHYKARNCQTTKTPLYTAPPASADSRLVPVELLERLIKCYEDGMSIYGECEELRALLARSE